MWRILFLVLPVPLLASVSQWTARVEYQGNHLTGMPSALHHPQGQGIEILDREDCPARELGSAKVELPAHCGFLRGIYRYIFLPEGESTRHQMLTEFSLSRKSESSYVLLVGDPLEIEEPATN